MIAQASATDKSVQLKELRAQLRALEPGARGTVAPLPFGLPALDRHLGGGLARGCLHEVAGAVDDGAALGFCAALAGRLAAERTVLWCQPDVDLYAPGLAAFGLDPARLIVVRARRPVDRLWAMEESLCCNILSAVVIELDELEMIAGRRLQLAAEASGVTAIVLHPEGLRAAAASVAVTRWRVTSSAGHGVHRSFSPAPRDKWLAPSGWQVELLRCRGGRSGRWLIEWTEGGWRDATGDVAVAAVLRDRPDPQAARA
jgi:protein ImuA